MTDRMEALEQSVTQLQNQPAIGQGSPLAVGVADGEQGAVPASAVYDMACQQVVGVTSEVNYTNFFGMTSSSAVSGSGFIVSENGYSSAIMVLMIDTVRYLYSSVSVVCGFPLSLSSSMMDIAASNTSLTSATKSPRYLKIGGGKSRRLICCLRR